MEEGSKPATAAAAMEVAKEVENASSLNAGPSPAIESGIAEMETRLVYYPIPDYTVLTKAERDHLITKICERLVELEPIIKLGAAYKRVYPPFPPSSDPDDPYPRTFIKKDKDGVVRRLIFRPETCRADDEAEIAAGRCNYKLPTRPTPSMLQIIGLTLPEGSIPERFNVQHRKTYATATPSTSRQVAFEEAPKPSNSKFQFPSFDEFGKMTPPEKIKVARAFKQRLAEILEEQKIQKEKDAEMAERAKSDKKAAAKQRREDAALAASLQCMDDRRRTRLSTGAISWGLKTYRVTDSGNASPASVSMDQQIYKPKYLRSPSPKSDSVEMKTGVESSIDNEDFSTLQDEMMEWQDSNVTLSTLEEEPVKADEFQRIIAAPSPSGSQVDTAGPSNAEPTIRESASENEPGVSESKPSGDENAPDCPLDNITGWVERDEWTVEKIIDSKIERTSENGVDTEQVYYKVKWEGWDSTYDEWVKDDDITIAPVRKYWRGLLKQIKFYNLQIIRLADFIEPESFGYFLFDDF